MKRLKELPLCYRFSFDLKIMTLFFSIQKWLIPELQTILVADIILMEYLHKTCGGDKTLFEQFGKRGQSFGYNNAMQWHSENEDEIMYSYTFTPTLLETEEACDQCNGEKIDFFGNECHECRETGKKFIHAKKNFSEALFSLFPIIKIANTKLHTFYMEGNDSLLEPQKIKLQTIAYEWSVSTGMHNCSMIGWFNDKLSEWVKEISDEETGEILDTMRKTEAFLLARKEDKYGFRFAQYANTHFGFEVPGNACSLGTSSHGMGMFGEVGRTLQPHNVDTRFQQLGFIIGMIALGDIFERTHRVEIA